MPPVRNRVSGMKKRDDKDTESLLSHRNSHGESCPVLFELVKMTPPLNSKSRDPFPQCVLVEVCLRPPLIRYSESDVDSDPETGTVKSPSSSSHSFNPTPHVFNLANCIVGVSVLAMPFVFQQCGILLAAVMIGFCSVLTKWTCYFLTKASFMSKLVSSLGG